MRQKTLLVKTYLVSSANGGFLLGYAMIAMLVLGLAVAGIMYSYNTIIGSETTRQSQRSVNQLTQLVAAEIIYHFSIHNVLPAPASEGTVPVVPAAYIPAAQASRFKG